MKKHKTEADNLSKKFPFLSLMTFCSGNSVQHWQGQLVGLTTNYIFISDKLVIIFFFLSLIDVNISLFLQN